MSLRSASRAVSHFPRFRGRGAGLHSTMGNDRGIHERISDLIEQERRLRDALSEGRISPDEEHAGLRDVEVQLDQCWDLLRRREALRNVGRDPGDADVRPPGTVEGYLG